VRLLALRHLHIQRQHLNFAHQIANDLIRRFDRIVIEDLNVKGMVRNHKLAKSISDAGWSMFTRILAYKAENAGRKLVKVNPAYTSQVCSGCGSAQKLKLSQRRYVCDCGLDLHRDHNAAINILASASPVGREALAT
jgi:putative transposase